MDIDTPIRDTDARVVIGLTVGLVTLIGLLAFAADRVVATDLRDAGTPVRILEPMPPDRLTVSAEPHVVVPDEAR